MKRICIYCGSSRGLRPEYAEGAREMARALADRGLGLVYGGGAVGLMGILADEVLAAGGEVIGVIPEDLVRREVAHPDLTELLIVESMHQRKRQMAELADGFIAMPGGLGTLEELFETWTWAQLGLHEKPCGLFDVGGYYAGLREFLDHAVTERFVQGDHRRMLIVEERPEELLDRFERYRAPRVEKWIDRP